MRLIDDDLLREDLDLGAECANCKRNTTECCCERVFTRMDICEWLNEQPTIEAIHVKHARWEGFRCYDDDDITAAWCSVCKKWAYSIGERYESAFDLKYCPNCGAKMDGCNDG